MGLRILEIVAVDTDTVYIESATFPLQIVYRNP